MLAVQEQPRLRITHKDSEHVYGTCSLCEHRLHAFIRDTEQQAMLLLNRGFKHHCRGKHKMVVPVSTKISAPRRSTRIAADVLIEVQGEKFAWAGETVTVNLHGALVKIAAPLRVGDQIVLYVQRTSKSARAGVVFENYEASEFGIELEAPDNIWGVPEPPADWTASYPE